jgi:hypothetical protein
MLIIELTVAGRIMLLMLLKRNLARLLGEEQENVYLWLTNRRRLLNNNNEESSEIAEKEINVFNTV